MPGNNNIPPPHEGKTPGIKPGTNRIVFVSDSQMIIDLLFRSPFYGSYVLFYNYPNFYRNDIAGDFLFARGILYEEEKFENTGKIIEDHIPGKKELVTDLVLLLNTFRHYYDTQKERITQVPFKTNDFKTLKEVGLLKKLLQKYDEQKDKTGIRIEFKIGDERIRIGEELVLRDIFSYILEMSKSAEYQNIFKFIYIEESESVYRNFLKIFPVEKTGDIDFTKLWTMKQSSLLLSYYLKSKNLLGMSEKVILCSGQAALFIGILLCQIGFLPSNNEYNENGYISTSYESYSDFLVKTVKSYIAAAKRIRDRQ